MLNFHLFLFLFYLAPTALGAVIHSFQQRDQLSSDSGPTLQLRSYHLVESRAGHVVFYIGWTYKLRPEKPLPLGIEMPSMGKEVCLVCLGPPDASKMVQFALLTDRLRDGNFQVPALGYMNLASTMRSWVLEAVSVDSGSVVKVREGSWMYFHVENAEELRKNLGLPPLEATVVAAMTLSSPRSVARPRRSPKKERKNVLTNTRSRPPRLERLAENHQ